MAHAAAPALTPPHTDLLQNEPDAQSRRVNASRFVRSEPERGINLKPRDFDMLKALETHGPLPSPYLHAFGGGHPIQHRKRLQHLWLHGFLERPFTLNDPRVLNDHLIYVIADKMKRNSYASPPAGGFEHALMTSITTANIELGCRAAGLTYISQEEILAKAPDDTRSARKPLAIPTRVSDTYRGHTYRSEKPTEPDQLFGIKYPDGVLFFAVEADRGNEPITRRHMGQNSILKKLLAYKNILETGAAKKHFGIPNLLPLFITTADDRVHNMLELAEELRAGSSFLFKAIPGFHRYARTPALMPQIFEEPWHRLGKPFYLGKKSPST